MDGWVSCCECDGMIPNTSDGLGCGCRNSCGTKNWRRPEKNACHHQREINKLCSYLSSGRTFRRIIIRDPQMRGGTVR